MSTRRAIFLLLAAVAAILLLSSNVAPYERSFARMNDHIGG